MTKVLLLVSTGWQYDKGESVVSGEYRMTKVSQ